MDDHLTQGAGANRPHRPLSASRLRDLVASELRGHHDVRDVEPVRSLFADRLGLDVADFAGQVLRIDFVVAASTPVWSRP